MSLIFVREPPVLGNTTTNMPSSTPTTMLLNATTAILTTATEALLSTTSATLQSSTTTYIFTNATTTMYTNTTNGPENSRPYPEYVGYITAFIAVIMYGSSFVPIKKFYTGDGMFFQWVLCSGIFLVGVVIQLIQQSTFYPLVMVGGVIWTTGNLCVVPIFKTIGMGLGMSTWSIFGLIMGWAAGRFGLFGTEADKITNSAMNYGGVALAFCSILLYVMVKNEVSGSSDMEITIVVEDTQSLIPSISSSINDIHNASDDRGNNIGLKRAPDSGATKPSSTISPECDDRMFIEDLAPIKKKLIGTGLAVFSGILYGIQFTPSIYVQDNYSHASKNGLDYVFAQFTGIYTTSCIYLFIYCAVKRNKPKVYPEAILPGVLSGIMWAIATSCWFIANAELSEAVSYPIIGTAPAAIASLFWGVVVFHEIKGLKNIIILIVAFCMMAGGAVVAGLSK